MRGAPGDVELRQPQGLAAVLALLAAEPGVWTPLAGGTDVMVQYEAGQLAAKKLLSLARVPELLGVRTTATGIEIGALATYMEIQEHDVVRQEFPSLAAAGAETGGVAIQNRGTLGGNIANASPAADSPPALLTYDAEIELVSTHGTRRVPYATFHLGYKKTAMRPDELIRAVHLPRRAKAAPTLVHHYRKVGTRKAQAISKVVFAATAWREGAILRDVRLAFGSVAATTVRARAAEAALEGRALDVKTVSAAIAALGQDVQPIDDIRSTGPFRRQVAAHLLRGFLDRLA